MDLKDKIREALSRSLREAYVRLEVDGGISGFVVSPQFTGVSTLDRQGLIDDALRNAPDLLSPEERRQVLLIAGLTPLEFDAVGTRIRVRRVRELPDGGVELVIDGRLADAEYVRGALKNQKGVQTTEPEHVADAVGELMSFRAKGTRSDPLTKAKVIRVLKSDPYIEVAARAS